MSDLIFYATNLVHQSSLTLSNEDLNFPATNIKDYRRTKVVRSTTNSDNVVFDTGETSEIDSIVVVNNPRDGFGVSSFTFQLHGSNSWGSPSVSQVVTLNTEHGVGYYEFTSTQSYRWARAVLTSTLGYCELSKIFFGKKIDLGRCQNIGWSYRNNSLSKISENRYGQKFVDVLPKQKEINLSLSLLDKDQLDQIFELYDLCGTEKPFFMRCVPSSISNEPKRYMGMYYLKSIPQITNTSFRRYSLSMNIEEGM